MSTGIKKVVTVWDIPQLSKEWIGPVTITANALPVTNYKLALMPDGVEPATGDWKDPDMSEAERGIVADVATGSYKVWAKYDTALESVVLDDVGIVIVH
jgi:hypothetical protein